MSVITKEYTALPTLATFHQDKISFVKYINGPVGGGKSSGCVIELLLRALEQQPDEANVRKTRWAVIRNHYPELRSTTIKTYQEWIPQNIAPVVYTTPIVSHLKQKLPDGTHLDMEVLFLALDGPEDIAKLLSLELTGAYINEARELPWEVIEGLLSRVPRFPKTKKDEEGNTTYGPTRPGLIMDSNPPKTSHWLYEKFETGNVPEGWAKYLQPPAVYYDQENKRFELNPDAENLQHLAADYYKNQINAASDDFIRVNLGGEFGMSRKGKPVFPKFSEYKHVSKEIIVPSRGTPLLIGFDFGLQPAATFGQMAFAGLRIVDEMPATDESLEDFLDEYIIPLLTKKYPGYTVVGVGDPAGRGRSGLDKRTPFDVLRSRGIKAFPARTNNFIPRKEAVDYFIARDGGLLISPQCTWLREALGGGYVWKESRNGTGAVVEVAAKNEYSHQADSLQYLCLHARFGGRSSISQPAQTKPATPHLWA